MLVRVGSKTGELIIEETTHKFDKEVVPAWRLDSRSKIVRERVIKGFQDRKWMGGSPPNWDLDHMYYLAPINSRNKFHLQYYDPNSADPYAVYKKPLEEFPFLPERFSRKLGKKVPPLVHQIIMANHWWTRRACHISAEMRTGKTLPTLSVAEYLQKYTWIVAPRSAIAGIKLEMWNWDIQLDPGILTYDEMVKLLAEGNLSTVPQVVIFDESTRLKTWSTLRTQAAFHLTEEMRKTYGDDHWVVAMSGTPAPKDPTDIWSQVEIVRPGYLYESYPKFLKNRLCLVEYKDNETGGQYPHIHTWFDDERKCKKCGLFKDEHSSNLMDLKNVVHEFIPSINEVKDLGNRLNGMSVLFKKKECLNLPDKIMEKRELKAPPVVMQYAQQIMASGAPKMVIINDLLQLSSGFYYKMVDSATETEICPNCQGDSELLKIVQGNSDPCYRCKGSNRIPRKIRQAIQIECPKDKEMIDLLEECEEGGRFVAFGSFQGCLDRMVEIARKENWATARVDSRGWCYEGCSFDKDEEFLQEFAERKKVEKLCFIAHPKSGGEGISLSAADTIMFWNNGFDGGARMQAQERGTDLGMNMEKGCRIVDLLMLKVDYLALENLQRKQDMQELALEELL